jgi:hypothetical protein
MRKKLITGAIVAAALAVPATPAFAIHDGTGMPGAVCSNPDSQAVGHGTANNPDQQPNLGVSNTPQGMLGHNPNIGRDMPCNNND